MRGPAGPLRSLVSVPGESHGRAPSFPAAGSLELPRNAAARGHLNHLIHHRGQLPVYLRLLDVPLPSVYGPTADERL